VTVFSQLIFVTLTYWLVGILPEENHGRKGEAWARIGAYRWAAWHFRKYLKYSDDSVGRAALAWCYANLGFLESARDHYRQAYTRRPHPDIACSLARVELDLGNLSAARPLIEEAAGRREELSPQLVPLLRELESQAAGAAGEATGRADVIVIMEAAPSSVHDTPHESPRRVRPFMFAFVTFAIASVVVDAFLVLSWPGSTPAHLFLVLQQALVLGLFFCGGLLIVHLPVLLLLDTWLPGQVSARYRGLIGAALVLVPLLAVYLGGSDQARWTLSRIFRLDVWSGLDGGILLGLGPVAASGAVFAVKFGRRTGMARMRALKGRPRE
jgi:tetratricopeptide (TPR) repeat protein